MIEKLKPTITKILKKTQKFTGTDNVYIAKHGFYLTLGNFVSIAASFLLSIVFARLLSKETYGQYQYILSIMAILAISSLQGMNSAVIRAVAKGFEGTLKKGFKTKLKWGLLGSFASIGVAIYFWAQGNIEFTISFLIIGAFLPLFKSGEIYQSYLDGKRLFGKRVTYTTLIQALSTIVLILVLSLTKNLIFLILAYFLSYTILRTFCFYWIINRLKPNGKEDPQTITYGKHLSLVGITAIIAQELDKILLFYFIGPVQLAIYSFATLPIEHVRRPFQILQEIALPKLSIRSGEEIKKNLPKKLVKSIIFILIAITAYIIIAPYFYKILYPQYIDSIFYSRLFSLTLLVFPMSMMTLALCAKMKTKELYKISIINPLVRITFLCILTPFYGILGAITAILLSQIFYFFLTWYFFKKM